MFILIASVLAFVVLLYVLLSQTRKEKLGKQGERIVKRQLAMLPKGYIMLHDLLLPIGKKGTTQIDHIVLSQYGVFVIETKNFSGWIYGREQDQQWTQVIYKKKSRFYNPVLQNKGHIQAVQQVIKPAAHIPIVSIVVFTNKAEIKEAAVESSHTAVLSEKELLLFIQSYGKTVAASAEVTAWKEKLQGSLITGKRARKKHVKNIQKRKQLQEQSTASQACPRCGSKLVKRNGANGQFFGCSSFPHCRFTSDKLA